MDRRCRGGCAAGAAPSPPVALPLFSWSSSRDIPALNPSSICSTYSGELTGNAWCLQGDGGQIFTGLGQLAVQGAPGIGLIEPSTGQPEILMNGGSAYYLSASNAIRTPPNDWTVCATFDSEAASAGVFIQNVDKTGNPKPITYSFEGVTSDPLLTTANAGTGNTEADPGAGNYCQALGWNIVCAVYHQGGDGTSSIDLWCNGELNRTTGSAHNPFDDLTSQWQVSALWPTRIRNALVTEKALDAGVILGIAKLSTPLNYTTALTGQTVRFSHSWDASCFPDAGTGITGLGGQQPCVNENGLFAPIARAGVIGWNQEFDHWSTAHGTAVVPAVTANSTDLLSPTGFNDSEKTVYPAVSSAADYSYLYEAFTGSVANYSCSVWGKTASGTATLWLNLHNDTTPAYVTPTSCALSSSGWTKCVLPDNTLTAETWRFEVGTDLQTGSGESATGAQTVYLSAGWCSIGHAYAYARGNGSGTQNTTWTPVALGNPLTVITDGGQSWSMSVTFNPLAAYNNIWPDNSGDIDLIQLGTNIGNNSARLSLINGTASTSLYGTTNTKSTPYMDVWDNSGGHRRFFYASIPSAGTHNFRMVHQGSESFLYVDNLPWQVLGPALQIIQEGGTGIITTQPSAMKVFPQSDAYFSSYCLDNTITGCGPVGPRHAVLGDSTFTTPGTGQTIEEMGTHLQALIPNTSVVYNYSTGGGHVGGNGFADQYANQWPKIQGGGFTYVIIESGINDACFAGVSAATATASAETEFQAIIAAGMKPIYVVSTPWKGSFCWTSGLEAVTEGIRTNLIAYSIANNIPYVDNWTLMNNATGGDPLSLLPAYDDGTHVHLTSAGAAAAAANVYAAIPPGNW